MLIIAPLFSVMFLYQNCAPAQMNTISLSPDTSPAVEMSQLNVNLKHDSALTLSEVELVADDVMTTIDHVPGPSINAMPISKASPGNIVLSATSDSSYTLALPRGVQKIIVARAKSRDPQSNVVATYYGNVIVTAQQAIDEVTIELVQIP